MISLHRFNGGVIDAQLRLRLFILELQQHVLSFFFKFKNETSSNLDRAHRALSPILLRLPHRIKQQMWFKKQALPTLIAELDELRQLSRWAFDHGIRVDVVEVLHSHSFKWVWRNISRGMETHWIGLFDSEREALLAAKACEGSVIGAGLNGQTLNLVLKSILEQSSTKSTTPAESISNGSWLRSFSANDLAILVGILLVQGKALPEDMFPSKDELHYFAVLEAAAMIAGYCGGKVVGADIDDNIVVESDAVLPDGPGIWALAGTDISFKESAHGV